MKVPLAIPDYEDDEYDEVFNFMSSNLILLDHEVFEARSTEEVVTFVKGKKELVDFIILSLDLPLYRGQDLVRLVKSRWPNVKIIVLCKVGDVARRRVATAAGADLLLAESSACERGLLKEAINSLFPRS